jgi:hypothetical protein
MCRVHSVTIPDTDPDKASLQLRIAACMIFLYKMFLSSWYLTVAISSFQHIVCPKAKFDFSGYGIDPIVIATLNLLRNTSTMNATDDRTTAIENADDHRHSWPFYADDTFYRQLCWTVATTLQTWQLFGVLMENRRTIQLSLYFDGLLMLRRAQLADGARDWWVIVAWTVALTLVYMYGQTLRRAYRHARLDEFAYRIPTPEVSTYTVCGQQKVGVIVRSC